MSLGNIKAAIISFHNEARKTSYAAGATELDIAIQSALNDISTELDCLVASETQALASGGLVLNYPTDYKAIIAISLTSNGGVNYAPLKELPGGHTEYRQLRDNDSAVGEPEYYSEFDDKFWLWRPANGAYTATIEYYRIHPQDITNILLANMFRNCVYFGTVFYKALLQRNTEYANQWGQMFQAEKEKCRQQLPKQTYICGV